MAASTPRPRCWYAWPFVTRTLAVYLSGDECEERSYLIISCYLQIVMEYCACGSLLDLMHACKRTLTEAQISAAMWGVLTGLSHLHEKKIIHRDLKVRQRS